MKRVIAVLITLIFVMNVLIIKSPNNLFDKITFRSFFLPDESLQHKKLILIYTAFFGDKPWHFIHEHKNYSQTCGCDFRRCELTYNQSKFQQSDAVIFHARDMVAMDTLEQLNKQRPLGQLWVYFVLENPYNADPVERFNKYFNMTVDYRLNSDARMPYSRIARAKKTNVSLKDVNYALGKTRQVAWLVGHCGTLRDKLAHKLEDCGIKIEVGGGCAKLFKHQFTCSDRGCLKELRQFRFYFSAENALCPDYVTEKYYVNGLKGNTVPIVFGGANYSDPRIAIPGSYIDALKFKNVSALADYIKVLTKDDKKFNQYFKWKPYWRIKGISQVGCESFMCDLCQSILKKTEWTKNLLSSRIQREACDAKAKDFYSWLQR